MQLAVGAMSARFWSQLQVSGWYFQRRVAPLSRSGELVWVMDRTHSYSHLSPKPCAHMQIAAVSTLVAGPR